ELVGIPGRAVLPVGGPQMGAAAVFLADDGDADQLFGADLAATHEVADGAVLRPRVGLGAHVVVEVGVLALVAGARADALGVAPVGGDGPHGHLPGEVAVVLAALGAHQLIGYPERGGHLAPAGLEDAGLALNQQPVGALGG